MRFVLIFGVALLDGFFQRFGEDPSIVSDLVRQDDQKREPHHTPSATYTTWVKYDSREPNHAGFQSRCPEGRVHEVTVAFFSPYPPVPHQDSVDMKKERGGSYTYHHVPRLTVDVNSRPPPRTRCTRNADADPSRVRVKGS